MRGHVNAFNAVKSELKQLKGQKKSSPAKIGRYNVE